MKIYKVVFTGGAVYATCRTKEEAECRKLHGQREFEELLYVVEKRSLWSRLREAVLG